MSSITPTGRGNSGAATNDAGGAGIGSALAAAGLKAAGLSIADFAAWIGSPRSTHAGPTAPVFATIRSARPAGRASRRSARRTFATGIRSRPAKHLWPFQPGRHLQTPGRSELILDFDRSSLCGNPAAGRESRACAIREQSSACAAVAFQQIAPITDVSPSIDVVARETVPQGNSVPRVMSTTFSTWPVPGSVHSMPRLWAVRSTSSIASSRPACLLRGQQSLGIQRRAAGRGFLRMHVAAQASAR